MLMRYLFKLRFNYTDMFFALMMASNFGDGQFVAGAGWLIGGLLISAAGERYLRRTITPPKR